MSDLIARLEKLTGPSRETDAEIENLLAGGSAADLAYILGDVERTTRPPHYTASIDAALPGENIVSVTLHEDGWYADDATGAVGHHPTSEAIARRAAALKARAA